MPTLTSCDREFIALLREAAAPPPLTRREWIERHVVIPDGPMRGERFRFETLPFTRLLIDELDRAVWPEQFVTGPSQSGKTLIAHVLPILYVACELRRNPVIAVPDMRMAQNKWLVDFEPVLAASPTLRALLPTNGPGSRGGTIHDVVRLTNCAILKFMTAGGDDTARAGYTADGGIFVTEAARFSFAGEHSVEADPLEQLRARMAALPRRERRLLAEGTLTVPEELPWRARAESTRSQIVTPCPHCREWVAPEREHLVGWHAARTELEAAELACWSCPACGFVLSESERRDMNRAAKLLHAGQSIDRRGRVSGETPATERLWFRWSAFHNLLLTASDFAPDEWRAARLEKDSAEHEAAEKKAAQFVWSTPYSPPAVVIEGLVAGDVSRRASDLPKGDLPADTQWLAIGTDCGMYRLHWVAVAFRANRSAHVCDYETITVLERGEAESAVERREAVEVKMHAALTTLRERCVIGWSCGGRRLAPHRVLIDAGWLTDTIHAWCRAAGDPFLPSLGRGTGQRAGHSYSHPSKKTMEVRELGDNYHVRRHPKHRTLQIVMASDPWKSAVHRALRVTAEQPGSLSLFRDQQHGHKTFESHLLAERLARKIHPRHGPIDQWENPAGRANHYFDALYAAFVGGHHAGFRLVSTPPSELAVAMAVAGHGPTWTPPR